MDSEKGDDPHQNEDFQFDLDSAAVRRGGADIYLEIVTILTKMLNFVC